MEKSELAGAMARRSDDAIVQKDGKATHVLPPLPYAPDALEPHIDARTMSLHHDMHHAGYVKKLNELVEPYPLLRGRPATWLILNTHRLPADIATAICNNAGGHVNHGLLWRAMSPAIDAEPGKPLAEALKRDFGSVDEFKAQFNKAGETLFGSGWVWLVRTRENRAKLAVVTTAGHGNPLTDGHFPILVNDVWEHAYYLGHQNRRPEYLAQWWSIVNWDEADRRFRTSDPVVDRRVDDPKRIYSPKKITSDEAS
jgi:Fe-Mn family superoxide dismutase